jgi:CBS domain-containing protein
MTQFAMPVSLYMSSPVHFVRPHDTLVHAQRKLREYSVSCLAVVDDDEELVGVVSMTDLLHIGRMQAGVREGAALLVLPSRPVEKVMTQDVITVSPDDPLARAARLMLDRRIHRVFVEESGEARGVVSTRDIMRAIREKRVNKPLSAFMSSPVFTVRSIEPISLATDRLKKAKVTGLVVVEDDWPVGVFTQNEALEARHMHHTTPVEQAMSHALLCLESDIPLHRAAAQAAEMEVRRIVAVKGRTMEGILTGIDLARAAA